MKRVIACTLVCMLSLILSVDGMEYEPAKYERSGSCNVRMLYSVQAICNKHMIIDLQFTQECVYQYHTAQHNFGEEDRETLFFSTDVYWHCESSKDPNILLIRLSI